MIKITCYRYKLTDQRGRCSKACHRYIKDIAATRLAYHKEWDSEVSLNVNLNRPEIVEFVKEYLELHFGLVEIIQDGLREIFTNKNEYFQRFMEDDVLLYLSTEELEFINGGTDVRTL
jgi:hypothetical protein